MNSRSPDVYKRQTENIVEHLQNIIGDLSYLLKEMANGNFDVRSRDHGYYIGDFAPVLTSMQQINRDLSSTMAQINTASVQVSAGAEQVSSGAQSLAQGATEQASAVQELAATINQISTDSQRTASMAEDAKNATQQAGICLLYTSSLLACSMYSFGFSFIHSRIAGIFENRHPS